MLCYNHIAINQENIIGSEKMESNRNYGIDLLSLVLMYLVCMLHVLGQGGVLEASVEGTAEYRVFWFLEILSFCAVDGFAIISGYMASGKPRKYEKLVEMWLQVLFYSFGVTAILTIIGIHDVFGKKDILKSLLPITSNYYWYFTSFFALFLSMPVLNKYLFSIDTDTAKKTFIIIILLFSIIETVSHVFVTNWGYSAIWLMVLYCIGVLAKRIRLFEKRRNTTLILLWASCIILSWGLHAFAGIRRLTAYVSPTILFSGIIMVVLFSRLKVKGSIIKKISPLAFGVYLFQLNCVVWNDILSAAFFWIVEKPLYIGVAWVIVFSFALFIAGLLVEYIRSRLAKLLRIPALSRRIVTWIDVILNKLCTVLG